MKATFFITIMDKNEAMLTDSTVGVELGNNQVPLTKEEYDILRIIGLDFEYGRKLIRDIEERIRKYVK